MSLRHVLLVFLGTGAASGYDIVKGFQHTYGYLWNASFQQIYRDLAKLHTDGLIDCEIVENAPRPPRKVYRLNPAGYAAMQDWLATPLKLPHINSALLVKLASVHLFDSNVFVQEFEQHKLTYQKTLTDLYRMQAVFQSVPPDVLEKFAGIYLTLKHGIGQIERWLEWADEVDVFLQKQKWREITPTDALIFNQVLQRSQPES
jgi:PadR family transcriptional regulator AphA